MQADNLLRLSLLRVASPTAVTPLLLSGERLSKHADPLAPAGKKYKLTDERLRLHARTLFPWLDLIYEKSSGWVHFSKVHVGVTMQADPASRTVSGRFPSDIDFYPYEFLDQVLRAMNQTTAGVIELVEFFATAKRAAAAASHSRTCADGSRR